MPKKSTGEGMEAEQKRKKTKRFFVPSQKKTQPRPDGSNASGSYWRVRGLILSLSV